MDDMLAGLGGADTLIGGEGLRDFTDYLLSREGVSVNLETNVNRFGHAEGDRLVGIEGVRGSEFGDEITGDGNSNLLLGEGGNDLLIAGGSLDALVGGTGEDRLVGGEGADEMLGGSVVIWGTDNIYIFFNPDEYDGEADAFVYNSVFDSRASPETQDKIINFESGIDKIDLSAIDANVHDNGDQAFELVSSLTGRPGEFVISDVPGPSGYAQLYADVDGDAVADFGILFVFPSALPTREDFIF